MKTELVIGRIRTSFGTAGEMKVESFSGESAHFTRLKTVRLRSSRGEREYTVDSVRSANRTILLKLAGIERPEAVAELRGALIVVPREKASLLRGGEFYCGDLEELDVVCEGRRVGRVLSVFEGGAHALVEVELATGKRVLLPFVSVCFGEVDLEGGTMELVDGTVLE